MKLKRKQIDIGYILVYMPDHPKALSGGYKGWVYEHYLVAERKIKRPLKIKEEVHHLDLVRSNNRPNNLLVCTKEQHLQIHSWISRGLPLLGKDRVKPNLVSSKKRVTIPYCQTCDFPVNDGFLYCSAKCTKQGQRKVTWPSLARLKKLLKTHTWVWVGKKYGVSDNAVRKWVRFYGADPKRLR